MVQGCSCGTDTVMVNSLVSDLLPKRLRYVPVYSSSGSLHKILLCKRLSVYIDIAMVQLFMIYTEKVFHQLVENIVSMKMDFNVTKRNSASNDQDLKVACETLRKLTLWCIEMEKLKAQKRDEIAPNPSQMIRYQQFKVKAM